MEKPNLIPCNISAKKKDKTALIRIVGHIGYGVNVEKFRELVDDMITKDCASAHLYINSPGGSCFDAEEMVNILNSSFGTNITGEGGALVASAAARIAIECSSFDMPQNGKFMIHQPKGGVFGTAVEIENYLKLLKDIKGEYFNSFKSKATDVKDFEEKWNAGDYWMTATEAKKAGFITNVREKIKIDKETQAIITAAAGSKFVFPDNYKPLTKNENMENLEVLATSVGLSVNADFEAVNKAVQNIVSENESLKEKNKNLQDKIDVIDKAEKETRAAEAKTLVDAAVKDGRLDADGGEAMMILFDKDHEAGKRALASIPTQEGIVERIKAAKKERGKSAWDKRQEEIENKTKH